MEDVLQKLGQASSLLLRDKHNKAMLETSDDMIATIDAGYNLILSSSSYQEFLFKLFGRNVCEGENLLSIAEGNEELHSRSKSFWDRALNGEKFQVDHTIKQGNNNVHLAAIYSPLVNETGEVFGAMHILRDVTISAKQQKLLSGIIHNSLQAIVSLTAIRQNGKIKDFVYTLVNPAAEEMLGLKSYEIEGKNLSDMFPGTFTTGIFNKYVQVVEAGQSYEDVFYYPYENYNKWLRQMVTKNDDGLVILTTDESTEKEAEEQLKTQNENLLRSNKELEEFAYVAVHDMKEPLRMIASYAELAEQYALNGNDVREFTGIIVQNAAHMNSLINDLLEYSKIGKANKLFMWVDLNKSLGTVIKNLTKEIKDSEAEILYRNLPVVFGIPHTIIQLFQNLVSNSIKYRSNKNPIIKITHKLTDDEWIFTVTDNGIGIPEEYSEKVFQLFQRLHLKEDFPGTGIGLATCKKIVEFYGGKIWVEPGRNEGTAIHFTLPVNQGAK